MAIQFALAGLGALFVGSIPVIVSRVVAILGFSYVTYSGIDALVQPLLDFIISYVDGLPISFINVLGLLNFDKFITLVLSGYASGFLFKQFIRLVLPRG